MPIERPPILLHPLAPDVRLELASDASPLDPELSARIDALWTQETEARGDGLFDGPIFHLVSHAPDRITLQPTTYRRLIAARRDPEVGRRIGLRTLGVTALLGGPDGIVLGRRSPRVHTEPDRWEPAPAGVVDRLDWPAVVIDEAWEELGLQAQQTSAPRAVGLIEEPDTGVFDILCRLQTPLSAGEILAAWRMHGSQEYEDVAIVAPAALPAFLEANEGHLLPALKRMLAAAGLSRTELSGRRAAD